MTTTGLGLGWVNIALTRIGACLVVLFFTGAFTLPFFLQGIRILPNQYTTLI